MINWSKKLIYLIIFFVCTSAHSETTVLTAYDEVINLMNKHYFDPNFGDMDWELETKKTRDKIINSSQDDEKYKYIVELFANLKHSHLVFEPANRKKEKKAIPTGYPKNINFDIELVDKQWTVTKVKQESAAWDAGLRPGMEIVSLNSWKIKDEFNPKEALSYYLLRNMLHYFPDEQISITTQNGQKINFSLKPFTGKYQKMGLIRDPSEFEAKLLPENIAYIRFSIFLVKPVQQAIQAIKKFKEQQVKGIILDLRNNPGGVALLSTAIAKEFCSQNYSLGTQKGRSMTLKFPVFSQPSPYTGKVIILMNQNSASTSEVLAAGMQTNKRVTVIGEKSAGMALPSVMVSLKDGSIFQYPIADFKTTDGKTIEGIGVIPDVEVSHTQKALKNHQDLYIQQAIKCINQENQP